MEIIKSNNPPPSSMSSADVLSQIAAQVEQSGKETPGGKMTPEGTAPAPSLNETPPTPVISGNNVQVPQKFQKEDGTPDVQKIETSTQQLEGNIKSKLDKYNEIQKKHTQLSQDLKKTQALFQQESPKPQPTQTLDEYLKKAEERLNTAENKMPVIAEVANAIAQAQVQALRDEQTRDRVIQFNDSQNKRFEELVRSSPYLASDEGFAQVQKVLAEKPYLQQGNDPVGDALALLGQGSNQAGQGSAGNAPPVIVTNHGTPPPSSTPTASIGLGMEKLKAELPDILRDKATSMEVLKKMDQQERAISKSYLEGTA